MVNLTSKMINLSKLEKSEMPINPKSQEFNVINRNTGDLYESGFVTMPENETGSDSVARILYDSDNILKLKDLKDNLSDAQKNFQQLRDRYHIRIAPYNFVIGKNERDKLAAYAVVRKINGIDLDLLNKDDISQQEADALRQDLIELYSGLIDYYFDCLSSHQEFFWDVFPIRQYVYGCLGDEKERHPYMIDIEIRITDPQKEHLVYLPLQFFVSDIQELEYNLGVDLNSVKEKLKSKISEYLNQSHEIVDEKLRNKMQHYLGIL